MLRREGDAVFLDSTVIVAEDIKSLTKCFSGAVSRMADRLEQHKQAFYGTAQQLDNGFAPDVNLYHILCGHLFDGLFFDFLGKNNIVSTSRTHPSGLDYIMTIYENAPETDAFSRKLLCSYNRYTDGGRALQSFGDSDGDRVDFFRFSVQTALETVPASLAELKQAWGAFGCDRNKVKLLDEVQRLAETGQCDAQAARLLAQFRYTRDGKLSVPVYRKTHLPMICEMERLTETLLGEEMVAALLTAAKQPCLLCSKHGVAPGEVANELYHIVFGQLNEALVARGFAAEPPYHPGEGRYRKSIALL